MFENAPIIGLIHNISKSQMKYIKQKYNEFDLDYDISYLMMIHDNPNISQDDLVKMSCQSKGNIAKILKKLEEKKYIKREVNPENRRKYMLKTTKKGENLVPKIRKISKEWEKNVGISNKDELRKKLKEISLKSMKLIE